MQRKLLTSIITTLAILTLGGGFSYSRNIYFTGDTPVNNYYTSGTSMTGEVGAEELNLSGFTWNWDGIQYSIYDSGLVLMMNFDNQIHLGETTGIIIKDRSIYGNHGLGSGGVTWTGDGERGGAYEFDGINDGIILPPIDLSSTSAITRCGRFKYKEISDQNKSNIVYEITSNFNASNSGITIRYGNNEGDIGL